ncbi:MAG TPA: ABC transporter permease [Mycobacteriales bacterium]|jgi:peptide/nickel transport system permease protein|nr:ABC transporter permease [Mycobacteriales bacterium]
MTAAALDPAPPPAPAGRARAGSSPGRRTLRLLLKRLAIVPLSMLMVVLISFFLIALIPQSTATAIAGQGATTDRVAEINAELGLDKPLVEQLGAYLGRLAHGDLGTSFYTQEKVLPDILTRLPATLELVVPGLVLAVLLGVAWGTIGGYYAGRAADQGVRAVGSALQAMPEFLVGLLLLYIVFYQLGWAPAPTGRLSIINVAPEKVTGFYTIDSLLAGQTAVFKDAVAHLVLPVLTIGLPLAAVLARITRATVGEAFSGAHAEYARTLGLPERQVVRYALVDARTTILTFVAACIAAMVGGDAIVEIIFNWQGVGQWAVNGMTSLDPPQIQGFVLFTGTVTLLVYIALDLLSMTIDPRISLDDH